jgi:hypothetical protein
MLDADLADRSTINCNKCLQLTVLFFSSISKCYLLFPFGADASCRICNGRAVIFRNASHQDTSACIDMSDGRLTTLALIAVERELSRELMRDPLKVVDVFATFDSSKNRRLDLLL